MNGRECLTKRADALRVEGIGEEEDCDRGEDCVKIDLEEVGGSGNRDLGRVETGAENSSEAGSVTEENKTIEEQYRCHPHPGLHGE